MINTIFFGSSQYSVIILKKILEIQNFFVSTIITKTDKPVGRSQSLIPNPVASFAKKNNLPLLQVEEFTQPLKSKIKHLHPDLGICVAFGPPYFDQEMIDIPTYKIINIHPSPLPKYRGATPGPWQIINGENSSAVTFFQIDALPDHGPVITQIPFEITSTETADSFYDKAFNLAADNLEEVLKTYLTTSNLIPQDHSQKTYFPKLDKETAKINWSWKLLKIDRFIRALNPWPIAWTYITNKQGDKLKMKIYSASFRPQSSILNIKEVQIEGKQKTLWSEISKYYSISIS